MKKKALAVVSFGTTYPDALRDIQALEQRLHAANPDCDLFRAFTSGMVIAGIQKKQGIQVDTPALLLDRLAALGYRDVLCQPTHVIHGVEYDKLRDQLAQKAPLFDAVSMGAPLLCEESDYSRCCKAVLGELPELRQDDALVLMGHGTSHFANAAYSQLENMFRAMGHERVYVGTVEGFPSVDYVLERLTARGIKRVYLMPFMIVAGDHAQNDLAGDEPDSWKNMLRQNGFAVTVVMKGLGGIPEIGAVFEEHLSNARQITAQLKHGGVPDAEALF